MKHEIFDRMHEKMTPREETVNELFARASSLAESRDELPSADTTGGIIMSVNKNIDKTNGVEISEVKSRRAGIAVAAAAALVLAAGAGAYGLHKGSLDTEDITSAAAASQTEEVSSDTASEAGAGTADSSMSVSVEDAKARVSYLEAIKAQPEDLEAYAQTLSIGEPETETDSGVECYVFNDVNGTTYYVPTGKVEDTGEPDTFMTELAAGQALTDAGIGHTEFDVLGVTVKRTAADGEETIEGVQIDFVAKALHYSYFIDNMGEIKSSSCTDARKYGHILTEDEAKALAANLLRAEDPSVVEWNESSLDTDGGVECYVFRCRPFISSGDYSTVYVPTGNLTPTGESDDPFMTETVAGQALTDAGVAHNGFESLAVTPSGMMVSAKETSNGWTILFRANGRQYNYFIDDSGIIQKKSAIDIADVTPIEKSVSQTKDIAPASLNSEQKAALETAAEYNGFSSDMLDVTKFWEGDFGGEQAYNITFTLKDLWRRYPEDEREYSVHVAKKDNELLPRIGTDEGWISKDEAERIIMEQKGFTEDDLYEKEFFNIGLEYFGGELAYLLSYEIDDLALLEAAEAKGEHYQYSFGIQTTLISAESGGVLRRCAMTEYEAKQRAMDFLKSSLAANAKGMRESDVEFLSVNYDSMNPDERYNFVCRPKGTDAEYHIIVPTGSVHGPETDADPFKNEPVIEKALNDAVIPEGEYDVLACVGNKSGGTQVKFHAYSMLFSYEFDESGNIVRKQCINDNGVALTENDVTEYEARRTVLGQLGYTLDDPNEFSGYSGTGTEGEEGWTFEFTVGGKSYKYIAVYNRDAADAFSKFTLKDLSSRS